MGRLDPIDRGRANGWNRRNLAIGRPHSYRLVLPGYSPCAESHRWLDAVLLHIKARARELAVVMLRSNHEYRGAGHQEAAVARGVSEDRGGRVNRVFGFSAFIADLDDVALRRLGNRADRGIGHH